MRESGLPSADGDDNDDDDDGDDANDGDDDSAISVENRALKTNRTFVNNMRISRSLSCCWCRMRESGLFFC